MTRIGESYRILESLPKPNQASLTPDQWSRSAPCQGV